MADYPPVIKYLFEPRSIAVVGASANEEKIGFRILENIVLGEYSGSIFPVNPGGGSILGFPVYGSVRDIEREVDLAVIAIPSARVLDAVKDCAAQGVKFLVIISSGFSEVGNLEEERRIVSCARENGMRVLGPNIFGIYSSLASLNATFGPREIRSGNVAIITQSGALGIAMIGKTKIENIGLSAIISVGNKADLDEADLLEFLVTHQGTRVILMYIEGIKNGEKLVGVLRETTRRKPVVVIKAGRSRRGAMAAASHTGSLAGADEIFSAIMRQCGALRAEGIQEALDWCKYLASAPLPQGENTVILTNGGGLGVLAADACEKYNVNLYDDTQVMRKVFSGVVPSFGSMKNPVDLTGQATMSDYRKALHTALANDDVHAIVCLGCEAGSFDLDGLTGTIKDTFSKTGGLKPMVFSFFGGAETERSVSCLRTIGIPIFSDVYDAVSCLGAVYDNYRNMRYRSESLPGPERETEDIDFKSIAGIIDGVRGEGRQFLLSHEAHAMMTAAGISMPRNAVARNLGEAIRDAEGIGYPVVVKVVSKDIIHKTDAGGVALDIDDRKELIDAYEAIKYNCRRYNPDARIEGVEIAEMVPGGLETIVGARRDPSFGPIVIFGLGGIYVEVMKDVSFRAYPLDRRDITAMMSEIRSYPLLLGVRGEEKKDINRVAVMIMKIGAILHGFEEITDIEINPLIVYDEGGGVKALDARILLSKSVEEG